MPRGALLLATRAVFLLSASLSLLLAAVIAGGSVILERSSQPLRYVVVSLIVGLAFVGLGVLLVAIDRQLSRLALSVRRLPGDAAIETRRRLGRLAALMLVGGVALLLLLGILALAALQRVCEGVAVFG